MTHSHHAPAPDALDHAPLEDVDLDDALAETDGWESGYADDWSGEPDPEDDGTTGSYDLAERHALRRVVGLSTELEDITEVEYRQLRLERVVLVGVWTEGSVEDAENS
ncbi:MAG: GTPase HflX, partial [Nocardioides sp.]